MTLSVSFLFAVIAVVVQISCAQPWKPKDESCPLILTPYIQTLPPRQVQMMSRVTGLPFDDIVSYSGFLTVNKQYNSNLFFWFFLADDNATDLPIVLWLQGGPGSSSLYGLFAENGPLMVDDDGFLGRRDYSWTGLANVLYIDNPVGTGFSFTDNDKGYSRNQTDVANNLYEALVQFFTLFPEMKDNDFYITGESYAGKYVPAISYKIHQENPTANLTINYKGMAIGDGWSDPISMQDIGTYLYYIGLFDETEAEYFQQQSEKVKNLIQQEKWTQAEDVYNDMFDQFTNLTGLENYYNYLQTNMPNDTCYNGSFLEDPYVRQCIHVCNVTYNSGDTVQQRLYADEMMSVKPWIETLLDSDYKILFYSGQLDIIVAHTLTQNFIKTLQWKGASEYNSTKKKIWHVDDDVAGYAKNARNFTYVIVRNAGHMVPEDQPSWAFDMLSRFLDGRPF